MGASMRMWKQLRGFNSSRYRLWNENKAFAESVPSGALVLDAGAGEAPYKVLFEHAQYESADFKKVDKAYAAPTYVCDLEHIPVEDDRFDFVVFNQVLEHVPEPKVVLAELHRVLKHGGSLIYTGPLFFEEHETPYDFYRYTQYGLRYLCDCTGFEIVKLDWLEGYFGTLGYQFDCMARYLPWRPAHLGHGIFGYFLAPILVLMKFFAAISSIIFHQLEKRIKFQAAGYPKNYVIIAKKK